VLAQCGEVAASRAVTGYPQSPLWPTFEEGNEIVDPLLIDEAADEADRVSGEGAVGRRGRPTPWAMTLSGPRYPHARACCRARGERARIHAAPASVTELALCHGPGRAFG
jgi:hypothetical protein